MSRDTLRSTRAQTSAMPAIEVSARPSANCRFDSTASSNSFATYVVTRLPTVANTRTLECANRGRASRTPFAWCIWRARGINLTPMSERDVLQLRRESVAICTCPLWRHTAQSVIGRGDALAMCDESIQPNCGVGCCQTTPAARLRSVRALAHGGIMASQSTGGYHDAPQRPTAAAPRLAMPWSTPRPLLLHSPDAGRRT